MVWISPQPSSHPRVSTSIPCFQEAGIDGQCHLHSCTHLFHLKHFFPPTCVCAYIMCAQMHWLMPPASAECVVFPVRWCVRIAIGCLVSLRGSSGSKGRCSGAAGGELLRGPPATVPSLWASSSERCLGCWEAAPGSWGPDAGKRCLGYKEEGCVCMCAFVCVCVCSVGGSQADLFTGN